MSKAMSTELELAKQIISPPGDTLQETIDSIGMTQTELAERMGRPKEKVNDLIKGKAPLTTRTAFQLENVLGVPANFWLSREKDYRHKLFEIEQQDSFEECLEWCQCFPIRELKQQGVIPETREKNKIASSLLMFFSVASPDQWRNIYLDQEVSVSFRISLANTKSPHAMSAWLRIGELEAKKIPLPEFDKKKFKTCLIDAKEIAFKHPTNFGNTLKELCTSSGVALVYVPNLPKAPISGATRWFQNMPLIQLSGRYKTNDHFWFTFFHEAAHILLHGKKDIFLENVEGAEIDAEKEKEADEFASRFLLKKSEMVEILGNEFLDEDMIIEYANKFRTPAGVIIGQLQHRGIIHFSLGNSLRQKIDLFVE